jgi:hypothetical protein
MGNWETQSVEDPLLTDPSPPATHCARHDVPCRLTSHKAPHPSSRQLHLETWLFQDDPITIITIIIIIIIIITMMISQGAKQISLTSPICSCTSRRASSRTTP